MFRTAWRVFGGL